MGKKRKQRERRGAKACAIAEATIRLSRWCCSLGGSAGRWGLPLLLCSGGTP